MLGERIGQGIAECFAEAGAEVVVAELSRQRGEAVVADLQARYGNWMSTLAVPASRSIVTVPDVRSNLPRQVERPMWSASKLGKVCCGSML